MRLAHPCLLLLLAAPAVMAAPSHSRQASPAPVRTAGPPHAWLFGAWTGGLFPVLDGMLAQDCRMPTVVFGQDVVGHSTLTGAAPVQRVIETVRTSPAGAEFRFTPGSSADGSFGCEDPNVLHVARAKNNSISFPRCTAFPYPLERCPS